MSGPKTPEQYVRDIIRALPGVVKDAMDPQFIQAELAVDISDNMGAVNRKPIYPRTDGGKKLQLVTNSLYRAATVYKGKGNASRTSTEGTTFTFEWGIDLDVIPYARIHELGGEAGRRSARVTITARPYITPALEAFNGTETKVDASTFTGSVSGFARIIDDIYEKLSRIG